jgi:hypothetical protein
VANQIQAILHLKRRNAKDLIEAVEIQNIFDLVCVPTPVVLTLLCVRPSVLYAILAFSRVRAPTQGW